MYINYKLLYESGLSNKDFHILQMIFQKEDVLLEAHISCFKRFEKLELIQYIKAQKSKSKAIRVSKKGKSLLSNLGVMSFNNNLGDLIESLISLYETHQKYVGNKLEVQSRLIWFVAQTGFSSKVIHSSTEEYLNDNPEFTKSLENLIWTPSSKAFSIHKNLKNSKLYDFICQKYKLDENFLIENKKGKHIAWLQTVSSIIVPKTLQKELYFTNSYETDVIHVEKLKKQYLKLIKT